MKVVLEVGGFKSRGDAINFIGDLLVFCDRLPPSCSVKVSLIEESKL